MGDDASRVVMRPGRTECRICMIFFPFSCRLRHRIPFVPTDGTVYLGVCFLSYR